MKKETQIQVLLAARAVIADKGYDCSLREISNASEVSYGHVHRTWENKEILMQAAETLLHKELSIALGEPTSGETISILLVKIWFSLQTVTDSRRFLVQTTNPSYPKYNVENPLQLRLKIACERYAAEGGVGDPRILAASLYMIAINVEPDTLQNVCSAFEVEQSAEELSILYLNHLNSFFLRK